MAGEQSDRLLHMEHVSKAFPGVQALQDVALTVHAGETLGLIGQNGAGKSTLMKILSGVYAVDSGEITYLDEPVEYPQSPPCPAAWHLHHLPGIKPDAQSDGHGEYLHWP